MNVIEQIQYTIDTLLRELQVDFVGIAIADSVNGAKEIKWVYVSGNCSLRYQLIRLQVGKSIAGTVWKTARPFQAQKLQADRAKFMEYPIVRMEKLDTVYACPILSGEYVIGVLMVAYRMPQEITHAMIQRTNETGLALTALLEANGHAT